MESLKTARIATKILQLAKIRYPFLSSVGTLHVPASKQVKLGETINVRTPASGATAQNYPGTPATLKTAGIPVKFDQWKCHRFGLSMQDLAELDADENNVVDVFAAEGVDVLLSNAAATYRNLITADAVTQEFKTQPANFDADSLIDVRALLNQSGTSLTRYTILGSKAYSALLKDPSIKDKTINNDGINTVATARVTQVAGMPIYEDPYWDESAGLLGISTGVEALALATAVPEIGLTKNGYGLNVLRDVVTDPETGMSILVEEADGLGTGYEVLMSMIIGVGVNDTQKDHAVRLVAAE
jgi:hypothetical protein